MHFFTEEEAEVAMRAMDKQEYTSLTFTYKKKKKKERKMEVINTRRFDGRIIHVDKAGVKSSSHDDGGYHGRGGYNSRGCNYYDGAAAGSAYGQGYGMLSFHLLICLCLFAVCSLLTLGRGSEWLWYVVCDFRLVRFTDDGRILMSGNNGRRLT